MKKIPLIIDTDPGHDDAVAIMLALSSDKLDVKGLTTVCGNSTIENTTENALKLLEFLGRTDIPVAKGASQPMLHDFDRSPAQFVHGENGMEGVYLPKPTKKIEDKNAVDFIADIVKNSPDKVTLAPLGPVTNIAGFLLSYPELKGNIEQIVIMGGGTYTGNVTPTAEYNIWQDPESAYVMFQSGIPVVMHSITTTRMGYYTDADYEDFRASGRVGKLAAELMDYYKVYAARSGRKDRYDICDANAIAYIIDPTLYETKHVYVEMDLCGEFTMGMTVADFRQWKQGRPPHEPNCYAVVAVDRDRYVQTVKDGIKKLG